VNKNELMKKLAAEQPLTPAEALMLDELLEAQGHVKATVSNLDCPEPSLAWRSDLNAKLKAVGPKRKSKPLWAWGSGILATGAAALAFVMFAPRSTPVSTPTAVSQDLATDILDGHDSDSIQVAMDVRVPDNDSTTSSTPAE
jgi:hypothetical protein